jgi:translocation and assembly module TamB
MTAKGRSQAMRKHQVLRAIAIVVPAAALVSFVAGAIVLHSAAFQTYLLRKIEQSTAETLGARIQVQQMSVKWIPLAAELREITVRAKDSSQSKASYDEKPLLHINRLQISVELWALLHHQVRIRNLEIEQPALYVRTDKDGQNNLPAPPQPKNPSEPSSFSVEVAHLVIRDGLLQYDDRQMPLSAELHDFRTQVSFDRLTKSYSGSVGYDVGQLQTASIRTFDHKAEMQFTADTRRCTIEKLDLVTMHSNLSARGVVTDYASPVFSGEYNASVVGDDLRRILESASIPYGGFALQGKVDYRTAAGASWSDRTTVDGKLESGLLLVPISSGGRVSAVGYGQQAALRAVHATYRLEGGQLRIDELRANALGGTLWSDSDVIDLVRNSGRIRVSVKGASIQHAIQLAAVRSPEISQISALADLNVDASWKDSPNKAVANVQGTFRPDPSAPPNAIPIEGTVALEFDAASNRASFQPSTLRTGSMELSANGVVSRNSALHVRLTTKDLHHLSELVASLVPAETARQTAAYDLHGTGDLTGNISGDVSDPHFDGQLSFNDLEMSDTKWRTVTAHVAVDFRSVAISDGSLVNAARGRMTFSGKTRLVNWRPDPNAQLTLQAQLDQVSTVDLQHLAIVNYPVEGALNGEVSVSGTQLHPEARGHIDLVKGVVFGESLNSFSVKAVADKQVIRLDVRARAAAGDLTAHLEYEPSAKRYKITAGTKQLALEKIDVLTKQIDDLSGQLTADVSGSGTLDDPQLSGRIQIPELHLHGESLKQVDANVDVRNKRTEFRLQSAVEQTTIDAKGSVGLSPGYPANVTLDSGKVPLGPLLARFVPPGSSQEVSGDLELHATLQGPLQNPAQLQGQAEIPSLRLQVKNIGIANAGPVRINYRSGVVEIANAEFKGQGTDLKVGGSAPIQGPGNLNFKASGDIDLALLQPFTDGGHSSGKVSVQVRAQGTKDKPAIDGNVRIVDAVYTSDSLPVGIESLNGELTVAGNRINVSKLSAKAGGGTVTVTGTALYGSAAQFNLAMKADSVRIRESGVRTVLGADLNWNGSTDASAINGRVTVDKLAFNQGSDLSEILSQFGDDTTVTEPSKFTRNVKLNVAVQSSQNLNLASSQLNIAGSADLNARGSLADPILLGRISLTGGEIFFLGKRFEIDSGNVAFSNPARTDASVNLHVKTTVEQYNITANIVGPIDRLQTTYTSDPALPTADVINLLAFGQTTAEAASKGATPASVGAESAVASAAGGQVASQVQKLTGLSQLTLNPLAGTSSNPGSQVSIQQHVTGNILLTISTDVTNAQNQSVQIQYQVKRSIAVSALRDENGGYGFDVRYHKEF